jgi:hypothetical protein
MVLSSADIHDGGVYFGVSGRSAAGQPKRYPIKLGLYAQGVCGVMNWLGPDNAYVVRKPVGKPLGEPVRLRFAQDGAKLTLEADGALLGEWSDPDPMAAPESLALAAYASRGTADDFVVDNPAGKVLLDEPFDDPAAVSGRFQGDLPPVGPAPRSSFFSAGIPVYITWEWGPEMSTVWQEDGSYDWSEVDRYLRKISALDPKGRLHLRFHFGVPPSWWADKHPDELVQTLTSDPTEFRINTESRVL